MVNHEDKKINFDGGFINVKRGQRITSLRHLSERWGWSTTKVKKFLEDLQQDEMIVYVSDKKKTLITIENYNLYQDKETQKKHRENTKKTLKKTNNNDNNENNNIVTKQVEYIWGLYPKKRGKSEAIKKIPRLIEKYGYEKIIECVEAYAEECKSKNTDPKYIKYASTFFNSGYLDYLETETKNKYYYEEDPVTGEQIRRRL